MRLDKILGLQTLIKVPASVFVKFDFSDGIIELAKAIVFSNKGTAVDKRRKVSKSTTLHCTITPKTIKIQNIPM